MHYFVALFLASIVVIWYLNENKIGTGFHTGMDRIQPESESLQKFLTLLGQGLINEITILRNYFFKNYFDPLYLTLLALQSGVLIFLIGERK